MANDELSELIPAPADAAQGYTWRELAAIFARLDADAASGPEAERFRLLLVDVIRYERAGMEQYAVSNVPLDTLVKENAELRAELEALRAAARASGPT